MRRTFTLDDLYALKRASDPQISPDGSRVAFVLSEPDRDSDADVVRIWVVSADGGEPRALTAGPRDAAPRWSPDSTRLAFVRKPDDGKPQVLVLPMDGGEATEATDLSGGVSDVRWAPDGRRLAVVATVDLAGEDEPKTKPPIEVARLRYKNDGSGIQATKRRHLFVVDGDDVTQLTEGDFDVNQPCWSPEGTRIAFSSALHAERDRDWITHVFVVAAAGGAPEKITEHERSSAAPFFSPDGDTIGFVGSEIRAARHARLYTVPAAGGVPKEATPGFDRNVMLGAPGYPGAMPAFAPDGDAIRFCARDRGCVHIYVAPVGGEPRKVVGGDDRLASQVTASADGSRIAYVVSTPSIPSDVYFDDGSERRLTSVNAEILAEVLIHEPAPRIFTAPDGGQVPAWLIRGTGDGPRPVLVDIHGGPHNAWGPNFASNARLYHQILAARGWSILLVNPRGSDGYGEAFYSSLTGAWGTSDMQDFVAAVDALVEAGEADPARLAVTGNSYGGYMTTWIVGHTDRFAAAVATGNVTNLESMYGTSDLGAFLGWEVGGEPHSHVEHFRELSPLTYAQQVTTPTLLVHGLRDDRCPVGQTEEYFSALRLAGKTEAEMVLYPEASHLFMAEGPPSYRVDYCRRLIDWVTKHAS